MFKAKCIALFLMVKGSEKSFRPVLISGGCIPSPVIFRVEFTRSPLFTIEFVKSHRNQMADEKSALQRVAWHNFAVDWIDRFFRSFSILLVLANFTN